ncbi:hypothetical protein CROSSROADS_87 [Mycobacterium phage Crossroads]|nr:hypothetical protein N848_gp087 [Mycobacterium phage Crossroads]YP_009292600.1 hypothetical protein BI025_gp096 [Mycobacterium phage Gardann]ALY07408.1 hypothetical protein SEA_MKALIMITINIS3_88 [Mycobacterium phage MkaliMitinis3]AOT23120.1 hypothetical protein SEA_WILDER_88 [Mycobacterium phage Wilder]ASM62693.1 hypothetical protein SEA_MILEY16_87 [Mycobacterium phage Miley16]ASR87471.1 hypothetical protein SEA_NICHOLASP3_87 [Mycobacterium phage Nicholasp3]AGT13086.1 hypothetical protein C
MAAVTWRKVLKVIDRILWGVEGRWVK